jgi:hypothetical protein
MPSRRQQPNTCSRVKHDAMLHTVIVATHGRPEIISQNFPFEDHNTHTDVCSCTSSTMVSKKLLKVIAAALVVTAVSIVIAVGVSRGKQANLRSAASASFANGGRAKAGKNGKGVTGKAGKGAKASSKASSKAIKPSAAPSVSSAPSVSAEPSSAPSVSSAPSTSAAPSRSSKARKE